MQQNTLECPLLKKGVNLQKFCDLCAFQNLRFQNKIEPYPKETGIGIHPLPKADDKRLNKVLRIYQFCPYLTMGAWHVDISILVDSCETMLEIISNAIDEQACFKMDFNGNSLTVSLMLPPLPGLETQIAEMYRNQASVERKHN